MIIELLRQALGRPSDGEERKNEVKPAFAADDSWNLIGFDAIHVIIPSRMGR